MRQNTTQVLFAQSGRKEMEGNLTQRQETRRQIPKRRQTLFHQGAVTEEDYFQKLTVSS